MIALCGMVLCAVGTAAAAGTVVRYEGAKWAPVDPARPEGTQIAVLRGDPGAGPSSMLMKMRKGPGVLHYHTADYELVVVEGRMRHWLEGQVEEQTPALGPGSYWHQPGMQPHGDSCLTDVCVMFITWSGKRDGFLANQK
jgi:quercetin dioxygenase-like cupin family protein